jgi:UDP:flavonoid glycosyltransferase YjiC (YdhE family)
MAPWAGGGGVSPFLGLASALLRQGHTVEGLSSPEMRGRFEQVHRQPISVWTSLPNMEGARRRTSGHALVASTGPRSNPMASIPLRTWAAYSRSVSSMRLAMLPKISTTR